MFWHRSSASYDTWIERLIRAKNKILRDHVFLGVSTWTGEPILLAKDLLKEHIWVTGGSGSGKSALILAPLAFQGKYPTYAWSTLLSLYQRLVPFDRWYATKAEEAGGIE